MGRSEQSKAKQKEYIAKYKKDHYEIFVVKMKKDEDSTAIMLLKQMRNRSEFLRQLIKKELQA